MNEDPESSDTGDSDRAEGEAAICTTTRITQRLDALLRLIRVPEGPKRQALARKRKQAKANKSKQEPAQGEIYIKHATPEG